MTTTATNSRIFQVFLKSIQHIPNTCASHTIAFLCIAIVTFGTGVSKEVRHQSSHQKSKRPEWQLVKKNALINPSDSGKFRKYIVKEESE